MNDQDRKQAIRWYCDGWDLITIAQHYRITVEDLKKQIRTI